MTQHAEKVAAPVGSVAQGSGLQQIAILAPEQAHARQLAAEMAEMKANGTQLDRTVPGGRYLGTDGKLHNAHGELIEDDAPKAQASPAALQAQLEAAQAEIARLRGAPGVNAGPAPTASREEQVKSQQAQVEKSKATPPNFPASAFGAVHPLSESGAASGTGDVSSGSTVGAVPDGSNSATQAPAAPKSAGKRSSSKRAASKSAK
jgi:hypothetical protein